MRKKINSIPYGKSQHKLRRRKEPTTSCLKCVNILANGFETGMKMN